MRLPIILPSLTLLLIQFILSGVVFGQDQNSDSLKIKSEIKLSPENREKVISRPELLQRIIEFKADQQNLPKNQFNFNSQEKELGTIEVEFRIQAPTQQKVLLIIPDISEVQPEIYIDLIEEAQSSSFYLKPIRPNDSRFEIVDIPLESIESQSTILNSFGVMGIVSSHQLVRRPDGYSVQELITMQQQYNVCSNEPFKDQPVLCLGTSFLIREDLVVTARHNLEIVPLKNMMFIIGYKILKESGKPNLDFRMDDVYKASRIIQSEKLNELDLVLIKLERTVKGAIPLTIQKSFAPKFGDQVYSLGYPVGLPMKYISNASVRSNESEFFYYTTLDTFRGNSGSPVFSRLTHQVIGVLVEGGVDFKYNGNCLSANLCAESGCKGEKVVNISLIESHIIELINKANK
jgi:hypothetical protein